MKNNAKLNLITTALIILSASMWFAEGITFEILVKTWALYIVIAIVLWEKKRQSHEQHTTHKN
jgi:hypothetical protein